MNVAQRLMDHRFGGLCPDALTGWESRDPDCLACVALDALVEQGEGEHVFLYRYGVYHASFGGIGGDAIRLDITREAWKGMGEPRALAVTWLPVPADETEGAARDRL
ncbi:hypothetical protein ABE10_10725 [Bacillus toyonensis]|nr:hypothetical protein [Bacillus toyonensis]MBG9886979.1 hypothetical protein [Bacillus toyonensis]MBG9887009.1 hypothetical protein [Bacillus toyonensis]